MDDTSPFLPDLKRFMDFHVVVSDKGHVYIYHAKRLPQPIEWIEYDPKNHTLHLIDHNGRLQNTGLKVPPQIRERIKNTKSAYLVWLEDGKRKYIQNVFLNIQVDHFADEA